jgi:hypothetical protein
MFSYYLQKIQRQNVVCKFGLETTRKMFQTLDILCDRKVVERHNNTAISKILCRLFYFHSLPTPTLRYKLK